ncbi:MAG: hypothetical protein ACYC9Y_10655 [Candidatus Methylomirabilia bacterium]
MRARALYDPRCRLAFAGCLLLVSVACATRSLPPPVAPAVPVTPVIPLDRCEACHGGASHPGCDGISGTADDAPNVMGDGTNAAGTGRSPKAFDDGTFGFNVNGHGANGTAPASPLPSLNPNLACASCHDLASPQPGTHFACGSDVNRALNTLQWPGKPNDTRNANTAHLVAGYLPQMGSAREQQVAFDDYCASACHRDLGVSDMRHGTRLAGVPDKVMEFNIDNDTTDNPKRDRGLDRTLVPWTIDDLTTAAKADPPQVRYYGTCVSCHDPHGTATQQKTRGTNKMVVRDWKGPNMQPFCGSACHTMP